MSAPSLDKSQDGANSSIISPSFRMAWQNGGVSAPRGPVMYDSSNHIQILFQCFGSLWPRVLPYCALNVLIMTILAKLKVNDYFDATISGQGHSYAGVIVSFLVVSRINTAIARYNECRGYLAAMYRETRELLQTAYILTRRDGNLNRDAKEWRNELSYRALVMLRCIISVIEYGSEKVPAWEVPELSGFELDYVTPANEWRRVAQTANTELTDSFRVPLRLVFLLRETICNQKTTLTSPLAIPQELKLLGTVDSIMTGWFGMRKFLTTPVPFPLIQMTRTIVFIYVFTLPLVFIKDSSDGLLIENCMVIFLLTYGFVGLELVSIELDDPFGHDENDFDCLAYARVVFEDTFLMINDTDGPEWGDIVRLRMSSRQPQHDQHQGSGTNRTNNRSPQKTGGASQEFSESTELLYDDEYSV